MSLDAADGGQLEEGRMSDRMTHPGNAWVSHTLANLFSSIRNALLYEGGGFEYCMINASVLFEG